jgi:LPS sulfotransferase NodH
LEYLQKYNFTKWQQRAHAESDVLGYIKSVRTSGNGCFGLKVHHNHLGKLLRLESEGILSYKCILLERRDLLAQAVSYARAAQTDSWISEMDAARAATYDAVLIQEKLDRIARGVAAWRQFTYGLGLPTLQLSFEDVLDQPEEILTTIARFLGVDMPAVEVIPGVKPSSQSAAEDDWAERFVADTRRRLTSGGVLPGGPRRPTLHERSSARLRGLRQRFDRSSWRTRRPGRSVTVG